MKSLIEKVTRSFLVEKIGDAILSFLSKKETESKIWGVILPYTATAIIAQRMVKAQALQEAFSLGWASLNPNEQRLVTDIAVLDFGKAFEHMKSVSFMTTMWVEKMRSYPLKAIHFMTDYDLAEWYAANKNRYQAGISELVTKSVEIETQLPGYTQ